MKSLISIDDIDSAEATAILDETHGFAALMKRKIKKAPVLRGRTIINMFFESSTRTRSSFEIAGWNSVSAMIRNTGSTMRASMPNALATVSFTRSTTVR